MSVQLVPNEKSLLPSISGASTKANEQLHQYTYHYMNIVTNSSATIPNNYPKSIAHQKNNVFQSLAKFQHGLSNIVML
jgi:hypothetical protein